MSIWIETYRPQNLDSIVGNQDTIKILKEYIEKKNVPNLLFYGKAGIGKTSTILALCRELYGDSFKDNVLELNASNDRGINIVRNIIKSIARTSVNNGNVSFKMIILDEADFMTKEAMFALRMIMELYSSVSRFCLICNYVHKIIDPIVSRCAKFHFKNLSNLDMQNKLKFISDAENLNTPLPMINDIIRVSDSDMRKAVMLLQYTKYNNNVYELAGLLNEDKLLNIFKIIKTGKLNDIMCISKEIANQGYTAYKIVKQLHKLFIYDKDISDKHKALICLYIANIERRLIENSTEFFQILAVLVKCNSILH